jgi:hypothetical protein
MGRGKGLAEKAAANFSQLKIEAQSFVPLPLGGAENGDESPGDAVSVKASAVEDAP